MSTQNINYSSLDGRYSKPFDVSTAIATQAATDAGKYVAKALNFTDIADSAAARTNLGLGNVNNTADTAKPVSTSQAIAIAAAAAQVAATTSQLRKVAATPIMASPYTITVEATSPTLSGATSTVSGTLYTPLWVNSVFYPAGVAVLNPSDGKTVIVRTTAGTSRASYDATEAALWISAPDGRLVDYPMRWNSSFIRQKSMNVTNCYGTRAPTRGDGLQDDPNTLQTTIWSVDFDWYTVAGAFEVGIYNATQLRFIIDGLYVSAAPTPGPGGYGWQYVKLSGVTAGYHQVRVEVGSGTPLIGGIKIASADSVYPPSLSKTKMLAVIGDSFGEGATGTTVPDIRGYVGELSRLLGFTDLRNLSIAATGFTTPSTQLYGARIADLALLQPDYILIQGTSNDQPNVASLTTAAQSFFTAIKAQCPNSNVVATGQLNHVGATDTITPALRTAAANAGISFLDTTDWNVIGPAGMAVGDNTHPTLVGHDYLARRLAMNLATIWNLPL